MTGGFRGIVPSVESPGPTGPEVGSVAIVNIPLKWDVKARVDHDNKKHKPGGGNVKIINEVVHWEAEPTVPRARVPGRPGVLVFAHVWMGSRSREASCWTIACIFGRMVVSLL